MPRCPHPARVEPCQCQGAPIQPVPSPTTVLVECNPNPAARFNSTGPGTCQVIAVKELLRGAIFAVEGMKTGSVSVDNIASHTAKRAIGTLDCNEWQCWAHVYAASYNLVTKPMFQAVMENEGFNMPPLVRGMWKEWADIADGMVLPDGTLDVDKCPGLEGFLSQVSAVEKTAVLAGGLPLPMS